MNWKRSGVVAIGALAAGVLLIGQSAALPPPTTGNLTGYRIFQAATGDDPVAVGWSTYDVVTLNSSPVDNRGTLRIDTEVDVPKYHSSTEVADFAPGIQTTLAVRGNAIAVGSVPGGPSKQSAVTGLDKPDVQWNGGGSGACEPSDGDLSSVAINPSGDKIFALCPDGEMFNYTKKNAVGSDGVTLESVTSVPVTGVVGHLASTAGSTPGRDMEWMSSSHAVYGVELGPVGANLHRPALILHTFHLPAVPEAMKTVPFTVGAGVIFVGQNNQIREYRIADEKLLRVFPLPKNYYVGSIGVDIKHNLVWTTPIVGFDASSSYRKIFGVNTTTGATDYAIPLHESGTYLGGMLFPLSVNHINGWVAVVEPDLLGNGHGGFVQVQPGFWKVGE